MEYDLVIYMAPDFNIKKFTERVNEKLVEGWKLQGGVACFPMPGNKECIFFAQAIIKEKELVPIEFEGHTYLTAKKNTREKTR